MSKKSKALVRKELRKTHKAVKNFLRHQEYFNKFAGLKTSVHEEYLEEHICEKQLDKIWKDLEKFSNSFEDAGGYAKPFKEFVMTHFAFNTKIIKDMANMVK